LRQAALWRIAGDWLKSKNPAAPAMKREKEEDWGKGPALIRSRLNAGAKNRAAQRERAASMVWEVT
jgi:hypothetical protein